MDNIYNCVCVSILYRFLCARGSLGLCSLNIKCLSLLSYFGLHVVLYHTVMILYKDFMVVFFFFLLGGETGIFLRYIHGDPDWSSYLALFSSRGSSSSSLFVSFFLLSAVILIDFSIFFLPGWVYGRGRTGGDCSQYEHGAAQFHRWLIFWTDGDRGDFGRFVPQIPTQVPLWLAVALKRRGKCTFSFRPPQWLSVGKRNTAYFADNFFFFEGLSSNLEAEREPQSKFQAFHLFGYVEIARLLFD